MAGPGINLIGQEEIDEVLEVLQSRHLSRYGREDDPTFGTKVRRVEEEIARLCGVGYALGTNAGTTALWCALGALKIGPAMRSSCPASPTWPAFPPLSTRVRS